MDTTQLLKGVLDVAVLAGYPGSVAGTPRASSVAPRAALVPWASGSAPER